MHALGWVLGIGAAGAVVFLLYRAHQAQSVGVHPLAAVKAPFTPVVSLKLQAKANTGAGHF